MNNLETISTGLLIALGAGGISGLVSAYVSFKLLGQKVRDILPMLYEHDAFYKNALTRCGCAKKFKPPLIGVEK